MPSIRRHTPLPHCSKHVMNPEVPQALRLQAILVSECLQRPTAPARSTGPGGPTRHPASHPSLTRPGSCRRVSSPGAIMRGQGCLSTSLWPWPAGGVVIIFNKQQAFLLEDCNEMLVR